MICACVIVMIKSSSEINISSANTTRLKTFFPPSPFQAKSKSRSSSVPAGARRHTFQVPKAPSGKK